MSAHNFYERKLLMTEAFDNLKESMNLLIESEYLIEETNSVVTKFHQDDAKKFPREVFRQARHG